MLLRDFSGGLNTRLSPTLLSPNEAQVYENIDNQSGTLKPIKGPLNTGISVNTYFTYFQADTEWVSKAIRTDFVEFRENLYMSNGSDLVVYKDLVETKVGLDRPTFKLEGLYPTDRFGKLQTYAASTNIIAVDALNGILAGDTVEFYTASGGYQFTDVLDGTAPDEYVRTSFSFERTAEIWYIHKVLTDDIINYTYTYYDSVRGIESSPILPSDDVAFGAGNVTLPAIPISENVLETNIDTIRLYRIGGALTQYTLVDELPYPSSEYADTSSDLDLAGNHILDSVENLPPPSGLQYLTEAYAMLFGALGSKLYYSKIGQPQAWPATYFIDFAENITGIGAVSNGLLVFTKYKTYIIVGSNPDAFSKYTLSSSQGCIAHSTISYVDNSLIWVSTDGICTSNGGAISVISMEKLGKLSFLEVYSAAVLDSVYYLSYRHPLGDKIMAYDFRYNTIVRELDSSGKHIYSALDNLYQADTGLLQRLLADADLTMSYKSPRFDEDSTLPKLYDNVQISCGKATNKSGTVKVFVDGDLVDTVTLSGSLDVNYLEALSAKFAFGNYIEFEVAGDIEVLELKYDAFTRYNIIGSPAFFRTANFPEVVAVNGNSVIAMDEVGSYKTPVIPIDIGNNKLFNVMYFTFIGTVTVEVFLNGASINSYSLTSDTLTTVEKKLPAVSSRAYYIEFEYTLANGAKLYAVETPVTGRQNGR